MRPLATALLLLLLPALLLPAGLLLRICRCAEPTPAAPVCCAMVSPSTADEAPPGCCSHGAPRAPADDQQDYPPAAHARECGCVWVPLTEDQPEPTLPEPPALVAMEAPRAVALVLPSMPAPVRAPGAHAARSRPPPDQQRSLPLRL